MALADYKITDDQISAKGVVAAPDQLTGTAAENKAVFDRLIREAVKGDLNGLIDALIAAGVGNEVLLPSGNPRMKYLRKNANNILETSTDGTHWSEVSAAGSAYLTDETATSLTGILQGDGTSLSGKPIEIVSGTDLDSLMVFGIYRCQTSAVAGTLENCPIDDEGFGMIVVPLNSNSRPVQMIFGSSKVYTRRKNSNGTFTRWHADELDGSTETTLYGILWGDGETLRADPITIPSGRDLDVYTDPGLYRCTTETIAASLGHCPVTDAPFDMMTLRVGSGDKVLQVIMAEKAICTRISDGDGDFTGNWYTDTGRIKITAATATSLNGVLAGNGSTVTTKAVDSAPDSSSITNLITSAGVANALAKEILFYPSQTVNVASNAQILRIPASGTDSAITADTVLLSCTFEDPRNICGPWTWKSYAGYFTITGSCGPNGTTADVVLGRKGN